MQAAAGKTASEASPRPTKRSTHSDNDTEQQDSESEGYNRHCLTAVEKQRLQLERLMERGADKELKIPDPKKKPKLPPPKDFLYNIPGSSAGAGSGEFHIYRAHRRREYARVKMMEEESKEEEAQRLFEEKRQELQQLDEEKTAKRRAKRQKKKQKPGNRQPRDNNDGLVKSVKGSADTEKESRNEGEQANTDNKHEAE